MINRKMRRHMLWGILAVSIVLLQACAGYASYHKASGSMGDANKGDEPIVGTAYDPSVGTYLVDAEGMTLYLFTRDEDGVSNCSGGCAAIWPPFTVKGRDDLVVPEGLDGFDVIERSDGSLQVTYHGMPLYGWVRDEEPGDITGHNVNEVWFVVNPRPTVRVLENDALGRFLVDGAGRTLYLFTNDETNVSNCSGRCAQNWPPLIVAWGDPVAGPGVQGDLGIITRDDGARQVTYNGVPLYYWIGDRKPGDTNGQGVGDVWFVVEP